MGLMVAAALWGLAEATLFFIVPDVLLSAIAVRSGRRAALSATGWTVIGAVAGGALIYRWGAEDSAGVIAILDRLPAISPAMIARVGEELRHAGLAAMVVGAFSGVPYKLYAAMAPASSIGLVPFLAASIPIRALRPVAVVLVVDWVNKRLAARLSPRRRMAVLAVLWLVFYAAYFAAMPN